MNSIVKTQEGYALQQRQEPQISHNLEIKIQLHSAALCRTDLFVANGSIPVEEGRILGHEATGTVVECGSSVQNVKTGDRIIINPLRSCRRCPACLSKHSHHCQNSLFMGIDYDGAFTEFTVTPENNVHLLPDNLSFALGAYSEPLAATLAILETSLQSQQNIAIAGTGRIAKLALEVLTNHGFTNVKPLHHAKKYELFDAIVESTLSQRELQQCIHHLRPEGTLVLKSRNPYPLTLPTLPILKKRIHLEAVYYASFNSAIDYLVENKIEIEKLIGKTWHLSQYKKAFDEASNSESLKTYFQIT